MLIRTSTQIRKAMKGLMQAFLLLFLCIACVGSDPRTNLPASPGGPGVTVYLVSHGWHAGIVIKRADIPQGVWPQHKDFPDAEFLEVGWGDNDYYQTPDAHLGITLKAALLPTASALHIVGFSGPVSSYFPRSEIIKIRLSEPGFEKLCRTLAQSYWKDPAGDTVPLGPGLYGNSLFYRSRETYHLLNNCNAWMARALRIAGCPISPASILTVKQLMTSVSACGTVIQSQPNDS
jgi:uncharacterized protein (TIGR02117 family)